jgi:5-formyltetrahydrofolate cyclo-ligase
VTDDVACAKEELRAAIIAARRTLTAEERALAGQAIAGHGLEQWRGTHTIAAYLSVRTEPPTEALLDGLAAGGTRLLLPVIDGAGLDWAVYNGSHTTTAGPLGISEPIGPRLGAEAVREADLVVVPAFAVDHAGHRLGRGRGYYDRSLLDVSAPIVAVLYDSELVDEVPTKPHDHSVDAVLQPAGFIRLS